MVQLLYKVNRQIRIYTGTKRTGKPSTTEPWKYNVSTERGYINLSSANTNTVTTRYGTTNSTNIYYNDSLYTEYTILALLVSAVLLLAVIALVIWYKRR